MKIALVQQRATPDKSSNLARGVEAVHAAAKQGARLVCFAELAFEPFYPQRPSDGRHLELAEPIPGPTTDTFRALAKELHIVIIPNLYERDGDAAYDTSPVIDADGRLLGAQRMVHIPDYEGFHERTYYTPGTSVRRSSRQAPAASVLRSAMTATTRKRCARSHWAVRILFWFRRPGPSANGRKDCTRRRCGSPRSKTACSSLSATESAPKRS